MFEQQFKAAMWIRKEKESIREQTKSALLTTGMGNGVREE